MMTQRFHVPILALAMVGTFHAGSAIAGPTGVNCATSDVQVTSASRYDGLSADANLVDVSGALSLPMHAANCAGGFSGNDMPKPSVNLGYLGDGLLNGAGQQPGGDVLFPGGAFLTDTYPASDLNGNGEATDPGWIMLGRVDTQGNEPGNFAPEKIGGDDNIVWASFFSITVDGAGIGTWAFTPDPEVAQRAESLLGKNYFDQFALIFKSGNAFAVYNFTAEQFGVSSPSADDHIFHFFGTYDTTGTLLAGANGNPAGLSHVSLWARDPSNTTSIPEPSMLGLLGLALLGMGFVRRRSRQD